MKNFEDFIYSIDSDTYNTICHNVDQAIFVSGRTDPSSRSYFMALEMLERYHEWINED